MLARRIKGIDRYSWPMLALLCKPLHVGSNLDHNKATLSIFAVPCDTQAKPHSKSISSIGYVKHEACYFLGNLHCKDFARVAARGGLMLPEPWGFVVPACNTARRKFSFWLVLKVAAIQISPKVTHNTIHVEYIYIYI